MRRIVAIVLLALAMCAGTAAASTTGPPDQVRIALGTPLEQALAWGEAAGPHGAHASRARVLPSDPDAIRIAVPRDGSGTYRLAWSVLAADGHPIAGTRVLVVGSPVPAAPVLTPRGADGVGPWGVIARLLVLVGVLGTLGMTVTRRTVMATAWRSGGIAPPADGGADARRSRAAAAAAGPVRMWWRTWWGLKAAWGVGLLVALVAQVAVLGIGWGEVGTLLTDTRWGVAWITLAVLSVLTDLIALAVRRGGALLDPGVGRTVALALPGAIGVVVLSAAGHAGTGTDAGLGTAFDALHAWATAAWLGGLLMLAVLAVPLLRALDDEDRVRLGAGVIVRFSALAVAAVVVLVVTGVYRALAELPSFDALWTTSYGVVLLVKLAIFVVMLALAAWNRFSLHPRLERDALGIAPGGARALAALRTSIRAEVLLAALVMVAVALLVSIPPPV
jgi:putative copper export protein/methionine-rich copper-binding protein CopC